MARDVVFNPRRHRLLRKEVPLGENVAALALGLALAGTVLWVWSTRERIDPASRDLPVELLYVERPRIEIYTPPLELWVEPGREGASSPEVALGMYPAAITGDGWSVVGRVRRFDASNLYEKINGEAEKFLAQGFVAMDYVVLRAPAGAGEERPDELSVELYDQGGVAGSSGIFAAHGASGRGTEERNGVTFFTTSVGVIGRVGGYFFRAAGTSSSDAVRAKAGALVDALAALAGPVAAVPEPRRGAPGGGTEAGVPEGMRFLIASLDVPSSAVAFKPENAFQLDFASEFWFADLAGQGADAGAEAFVHRGESASAAQTMLDRLLEEQAYDHEPVAEPPAPGAWLRHRFLGTYFAVARDGRYLYGVQRLNDPALTGSMMKRLGEIARSGEARVDR